MRSSLLPLGIAAASALLGAGCGGGHGAQPMRDQLAGNFRAALADLGKMDGNEEAGIDERPGRLDAVACRTASCTVRWTTWDGKHLVTRYAVAGGPRCFTALAKPRLPDVQDDTIGAYGASPLNDLSTKPGLRC